MDIEAFGHRCKTQIEIGAHIILDALFQFFSPGGDALRRRRFVRHIVVQHVQEQLLEGHLQEGKIGNGVLFEYGIEGAKLSVVEILHVGSIENDSDNAFAFCSTWKEIIPGRQPPGHFT